jgi:cellulose synthase/poly-beta-1,6-N-acetylglucosamine synthase-like glycosyltransferase
LPSPSDADLFEHRRHLRWVSAPGAMIREHWLTIAALVATFGTAAPVAHDWMGLALRGASNGDYIGALRSLIGIFLAALLVYGSTAYLLARIGHLKRLRAAARNTAYDPLLEDESDDDSSIVALVPSYNEDPHVVLRALISAALQPHTHRAVLLIDDLPEDPAPPSLEAARDLPGRVSEMLRPMREECERALSRFQQLVESGQGFDEAAEARQLAHLCGQAAAWFDEQTRFYPVTDVADRFFVDLTFRTAESRWSREADLWFQLADEESASLSLNRLRRGYQRLLSVFRVEITSFERKQFVNLSHAPNKAMNINSYLGLLGGRYRREQTDAGQRLSPCPAADNGAELIIPDADFVLILDADTIISPDYTLKLMRRFREPGGQRLAVAQSPYSTFPGDRGLLQHIAGAQTDVQYLVHQGLTHYNATYWVGANALVRMAALRDVAERSVERGHEIVKFIRDRTLIEDTESTIDLACKGWRLFNQPERLAFSMTPPDFGSLLIQRRRWANGGLLIVPKLLAYLQQPGKIADRVKEGFMRLQYLISLGPVSMALLVALGVSFDNHQVRTFFLAGTGLIYYTVYARDLHLIGYRWQDIFRVVALNLALIPINILGMTLSMTQAITGRKPRFGRTPKVQDRTRVPPGYVLAEVALLAFWCAHFVSSFARSEPLISGFMLLHAGLLAYGIGAFIGYRNSTADLAAMLVRREPVAPPLVGMEGWRARWRR